MPTNSTRKKTSYRLSEECRELIDRLKKGFGLSEAAVIEMATRMAAHVLLGEDGQSPAILLGKALALLDGRGPPGGAAPSGSRLAEEDGVA